MMGEHVIKSQSYRRRKKAGRIIFLFASFVFVICVSLFIFALNGSSNGRYILDRIRMKFKILQVVPEGENNINKPAEREEAEVTACLAQLAGEDDRFKEILQNQKAYPEELLASLVNNPEMIEFVINYNKDRKQTTTELTEEEKNEDFPLFLQWDQRWGYKKYGGDIIGLNGCGPTCLSMVIYALTRDDSITPDTVAAFSEKKGHYVKGTGTSWSLMSEGAKKYGLTPKEICLDQGVMERELDKGRPIICALRAGDFTTLGHFIMIYGYDENGFMINDPNCIARSRKQWTYEELSGQIKNMWSYELAKNK